MMRFLAERMTFDKLFRLSDPKRVHRSFTVKGPPLDIDSYQDAVYYAYNFKSKPSTTGLRHRGYVKFFRPRRSGPKPLQHLECLVDCTCPDYRYRWAWANKQRGSSRVGDQSLNQALNRAPRKTNPKSKPGLCKHILATREYIYGLLSSFPSDRPDTSDKLNQLTKYATRRWVNWPEPMNQAKERERRIAQAVAMRNRGEIAPGAPPPLPPQNEPGDEFRDVEPPEIDAEIGDELDNDGVPEPQPEPIDNPTSFAARVKPPAERGRGLPVNAPTPAAAPAAKKKSVRRIRKGTPAQPKNKEAEQAAAAGFETPAEYNFRRRQGLGDSIHKKFPMTTVVNPNGLNNDMNILTEAQAIIREMEEEELKLHDADDLDAPEAPPSGGPDAAPSFDGGEGDPAGLDIEGAGAGLDSLPPSEPPVSDSAIGADTEGNVALGLLREIRDFLGQLSSALVPEPENPEEGGEGSESGGAMIPGEGEGEGTPEGFGELPVSDPDEEHEEDEDEDEEHDERSEEEEEQEAFED